MTHWSCGIATFSFLLTESIWRKNCKLWKTINECDMTWKYDVSSNMEIFNSEFRNIEKQNDYFKKTYVFKIIYIYDVDRYKVLLLLLLLWWPCWPAVAKLMDCFELYKYYIMSLSLHAQRYFPHFKSKLAFWMRLFRVP